MRLLTVFLIGVFYLVVVTFGVVCLATGQFRSSTGSAYDTWRLSFRSNDLLKNDLSPKLEAAQKAERKKWSDLRWEEYCVELFDSSGRLKPMRRGEEKRSRRGGEDRYQKD